MNSITLHPDTDNPLSKRYYTLFGVKNEDCICYGIGLTLTGHHIVQVAIDQGGIDSSSLPPEHNYDDLFQAALKWNNRDNLILEIFDCETQADEFVERMAMLGGKRAVKRARYTVAVWELLGKSIGRNWRGIVPYNPAARIY